jgi:CheY-like chemotaxis protein
MKVLIAEDEPLPRLALVQALTEWGYEVLAFADGTEAWQELQGPDYPKLAILDWMLPGLVGTEICRRLRQRETPVPTYIILLSGRGTKADVIAGLDSGANDYITKPFDLGELRARVQVGRAVVELQANLAAQVQQLREALAQVQRLQGLLPICAYCRRVRDDHNYWKQVEQYMTEQAGVVFTHGICPDCLRNIVGPELRAAGIEEPNWDKQP